MSVRFYSLKSRLRGCSYTEAINILYTQNTFIFNELSTFLYFTTHLPTQRLDNIRSVYLKWQSTEFEQTGHRLAPQYQLKPLDRRWETICKTLQNMSLKKLRLQLLRGEWRSSSGPIWEEDLFKLLQHLTCIEEFQVEVNWRTKESLRGDFCLTNVDSKYN